MKIAIALFAMIASSAYAEIQLQDIKTDLAATGLDDQFIVKLISEPVQAIPLRSQTTAPADIKICPMNLSQQVDPYGQATKNAELLAFVEKLDRELPCKNAYSEAVPEIKYDRGSEAITNSAW